MNSPELIYMAVSILRREDDVHIFGRRMENDLLRRACSIVVVYVVMGIASSSNQSRPSPSAKACSRRSSFSKRSLA